MNKVEATIRLCLEPKFWADKTRLKPKLHIIDNAYKGVTDTFLDDEDLASRAPKLLEAISKFQAQMTKANLESDCQMPAVLWIRLAGEAGVELEPKALMKFKAWQDRNSARGKTLLYKYENSNGKLVGPRRERDGHGEIFGYTVSELLNEHKDKPAHWPYCHKWELVLKKRNDAIATPVALVQIVPLEHHGSAKPTAASGKKSNARAGKRGNQRTLEEIRRACGGNVVNALEESLLIEIQSERGVLQHKGRNRRLYSCKLCLDDLIKVLKKHHQPLEFCADNTLKSALPGFVACPRGRPKGITALLKKPRKPRKL